MFSKGQKVPSLLQRLPKSPQDPHRDPENPVSSFRSLAQKQDPDCIGILPEGVCQRLFQFLTVDVQARFILTRNEFWNSFLNNSKPFGLRRTEFPPVASTGTLVLKHPRWYQAPPLFRQAYWNSLSKDIEHIIIGSSCLCHPDELLTLLRQRRAVVKTLIFETSLPERETMDERAFLQLSVWPLNTERPFFSDPVLRRVAMRPENKISMPACSILAFSGAHALRFCYLMSKVDFPSLQEFAFCSPPIVPPLVRFDALNDAQYGRKVTGRVKSIVASPTVLLKSTKQLKVLLVSTFPDDALNRRLTHCIFKPLFDAVPMKHFESLILQGGNGTLDSNKSILHRIPFATGAKDNGQLKVSCSFLDEAARTDAVEFVQSLDDRTVEGRMKADQLLEMSNCLVRSMLQRIPFGCHLLLERSFPSLLTVSVLLQFFKEEPSQSKVLTRLLNLLPSKVRAQSVGDPLESFLSYKRFASLLPDIRHAQELLIRAVTEHKGSPLLSDKDIENFRKPQFFMTLMGPERAKIFMHKLETAAGRTLIEAQKMLEAQLPQWRLVRIANGPIPLTEALSVLNKILPPDVEIVIQHLSGMYDYRGNYHYALEGVASRLRALSINLDRPEMVDEDLEKLTETQEHTKAAPVARLGSINDMGQMLPVGSRLMKPYMPNDTNNNNKTVLPSRLDEYPPLPPLEMPNLQYLHLHGFNPYRDDHQRLLEEVTFSRPKVFGGDAEESDNEGLIDEEEAPPPDVPPANKAPEDNDGDNDDDANNNDQQPEITAAPPAAEAESHEDAAPPPSHGLPPLVKAPTGGTKMALGKLPKLGLHLLQQSGSSAVAPTMTHLKSNQCSRRHLHFEISSVKRLFHKRHSEEKVGTEEERHPVSHLLLLHGHGEAAGLHLVISLDGDCLSQCPKSKGSPFVESLETFELLTRLVRKVNPMSLTITPGPSPQLATAVMKLFQSSTVSVGRGTTFGTQTFPIAPDVTGHFDAWTFHILQNVMPLGITRAPWSYGPERLLLLAQMGSETEFPIRENYDSTSLLRLQARNIIATHQYRRSGEGLFAKMRGFAGRATAQLEAPQMRVHVASIDDCVWWIRAAELAHSHALREARVEKIQQLLSDDRISDETKQQLIQYMDDLPALEAHGNPTVPPLCQLTIAPSPESLIQMRYLKDWWPTIRHEDDQLHRVVLNECCALPAVADLISLYHKQLKLLTVKYALPQEWRKWSYHEAGQVVESCVAYMTDLLALRHVQHFKVKGSVCFFRADLEAEQKELAEKQRQSYPDVVKSTRRGNPSTRRMSSRRGSQRLDRPYVSSPKTPNSLNALDALGSVSDMLIAPPAAANKIRHAANFFKTEMSEATIITDEASGTMTIAVVHDLLSALKQAEAEESSEGALPDTARHGLSDTAQRGLPDTARRDLPDTARRGLPDTARRGLPDTARRDLPDTARRGLPDTARRGVPDSARRGIPDSARRGVPDSARRGVPDSARRGVPDSARQVVTIEEQGLADEESDTQTPKQQGSIHQNSVAFEASVGKSASLKLNIDRQGTVSIVQTDLGEDATTFRTNKTEEPPTTESPAGQIAFKRGVSGKSVLLE
eukprot:Blabericola_migrator_1__922@NODE_1228_length_5042_cov_12_020302_g833_i0_p1_GENE_NODE_1228_length_5042_cov_12_020302_g833_i0NODE_1228_length_5042_cov_12_020302_g833_i0_p1_ORF_typecomplete_len1583_score259_76Fibrinogen_BP/PF08017_11/6_7e02Fibrinogen_BP/PF08017_11/9_2e07_NODE_1228_length_5042_cov_12_020302_g833_i01484896